ncbi:sensor histidine kinase [Alkaliphilus transvaalensis]|uniref:sensor histidine kinase n=1 Tax=Alkaliphilus transvaalensis TaxID=114628 RepID=UPI0004789D3B|nr:ATP-binding protein [Alkaliphilus transvaalensis]
MLKALQTKLTLLILGGTFVAIILVSLIINITIFQRFDDYMEHGESDRIEGVLQLLHQYYGVYGEWNDAIFDAIRYSHDLHSYDINIRDEKNEIIFSSSADEEIENMHYHMMRNMDNHMGRSKRHTSYSTDEYEIVIEGQRVGTVEVGSYMPYLVTEKEILFSRGVNSSIFFAALISMVVSLLLGIYASKFFIRPIKDITTVANSIRAGNLGVQIEATDNTKELFELSQSINHLSKSLSEQKELRKRLTSDIAHELRTPLTILQSHIEAINDGIWQPTEDKLNICKNEVIYLIKLVEQLQHLTDIENHKNELEITQYSLTQLIKEVVESFRYNFERKAVGVNMNLKEITLEGDRDKTRQILINLLSNAYKFTNRGDAVELSLEDDEDKVYIKIKDTGVGIPTKDLPNIFERFYRSDESRNRKTGGTGIGLTIVASLIKAQKGDINISSQEGIGTECKIILPKILN